MSNLKNKFAWSMVLVTVMSAYTTQDDDVERAVVSLREISGFKELQMKSYQNTLSDEERAALTDTSESNSHATRSALRKLADGMVDFAVEDNFFPNTDKLFIKKIKRAFQRSFAYITKDVATAAHDTNAAQDANAGQNDDVAHAVVLLRETPRFKALQMKSYQEKLSDEERAALTATSYASDPQATKNALRKLADGMVDFAVEENFFQNTDKLFIKKIKRGFQKDFLQLMKDVKDPASMIEVTDEVTARMRAVQMLSSEERIALNRVAYELNPYETEYVFGLLGGHTYDLLAAENLIEKYASGKDKETYIKDFVRMKIDEFAVFYK